MADKNNKKVLFSKGFLPGSSKFLPLFVVMDQLLCLPLPLTPAKGFSCNKHTKPCLSAILFIKSIVIWL